MNWMIYGANGYTGRLIATEARKRGLSPILAGRREAEVRALADSLGLSARVFELSEAESALEGTDLVLLCAGPFSATSKLCADATIARGITYLDITGEISVFESLFKRKNEAKEKGATLIPGVGFDVVPTDCLAMQLKEKLPDATYLEMAMCGSASVSPGTLKSMVEGFEKGGWIRKDGKLKPVPIGWSAKEIEFSSGKQWCMSVPWGDVSTAFFSTGIPNITFYASAARPLTLIAPALNSLRKVMAMPAVQNFLKGQIEKRVKGPTETEWRESRMHVWGRATNAAGKHVETWLEVPEGYWFTMLSSLRIVEKILGGYSIAPGTWTPGQVFGAHFVEELPGVSIQWRN